MQLGHVIYYVLVLIFTKIGQTKFVSHVIQTATHVVDLLKLTVSRVVEKRISLMVKNVKARAVLATMQINRTPQIYV